MAKCPKCKNKISTFQAFCGECKVNLSIQYKGFYIFAIPLIIFSFLTFGIVLLFPDKKFNFLAIISYSIFYLLLIAILIKSLIFIISPKFDIIEDSEITPQPQT